MSRILFAAILAASAIGGFASKGHAALTTLAYEYVPSSTTFSAAPGSKVNVGVYVLESIVSGTNSLIIADKGLNSAGALVTRTSGTAMLTANAAYNTTDFPNMQPQTLAGDGSSLSFLETVSFSNTTGGPTGTVVNSTQRRELLTTLEIQLPATLNTSTVFQLSNRVSGGSAGNQTLTFQNFYDLDLTTSNKTAADGNTYSWTGPSAKSPLNTFTVTTTPEPSSLALLALPTLLALRRPRRTR